jgi:hypothetical protein
LEENMKHLNIEAMCERLNISPTMVAIATDLGVLLAEQSDLYALYWLRWARRILDEDVDPVGRAPLRAQFDQIDALMDFIEDRRAEVSGRDIPWML